ncbi:BCCT family transporter [Pseudovibrio japonicus]|uniref:BCCT family transporter n=1 Tax=Pseudovibrio japonicus TaxID=366534 RepID=A0ABQ3ERY0_9HYPH|nr:BCCT family transporter [Pseudovibrio japonicus]GHB47043.1 BCCT family transporter [Pseudovibrio japonicus]
MTDQTCSGLIPVPDGPSNLIDTDYEVGQDNITPRIAGVAFDVHNVVFTISSISIAIFVAITLLYKDTIGPVFIDLRDWLTSSFDWFFLIAGNSFVLLCLYLIVSPLGKVRIGGRDAKPDYSYGEWFSMLFAAGMGIGLVFYAVAEPLGNFSAITTGSSWAPLGGEALSGVEAERLAMASTIYHWALHPWATYAVLALGLALFAYNKGLPLTVRSIFYPILGERVWGWPGHIIDILAVFATLFGLATSLGVGAEQANAGLHHLFGLEVSTTAKVALIIVISGIALCSVVLGLDKGIKHLSTFNVILAALLLAFIVLAGPSLGIFQKLFWNLEAYLEYLPALSNPIGRIDDNFRQGSTTFYWAWWFSWAPFVGMFVARISRGRTVREFMLCVLIIPSVVTTVWMTAFGDTAIDLETTTTLGKIAGAATEIQLFELLSNLPLAQITSVLGVVLIITFFVTSSDSGSLVIDTITAGGKVDAPVQQRIFWATLVGLVAIALLLGGGLSSLQAMTVSTGFPFAIVLLGACFAIVKGLRSEPR